MSSILSFPSLSLRIITLFVVSNKSYTVSARLITSVAEPPVVIRSRSSLVRTLTDSSRLSLTVGSVFGGRGISGGTLDVTG